MNYAHELRRTGFIAAIVFGPLVWLGFVWANPHGGSSIAMHFAGLFLLAPIISLSDLFDSYPKVVGFAGLGLAQFIWSWFLVILLRVSYLGAASVWRRAAAFVRASRARRVSAALVATVLLAFTLFPVRSVTVPAWRVQFVDMAGNPFAAIPVRQIWVDSGLESAMTSREAEATTDAQGYVEFPERGLLTVFIANWWARTAYPSTSRHSYIVQGCDLMHHGDKSAMYLGEELPGRVALRYFSREPIRQSMNLRRNPTCTAAESQARAADASKGIKDVIDSKDCNPAGTTKAPPNPSIQCGRAKARAADSMR